MLAKNPGADPSYQSRSTACWNLLQHLLSCTSATHANDWTLSHAASGAPRVKNRRKPSLLSVSMAHSADWLAAAVALEAGIGVDIERARPRDSMLAIAEYLGWRSKTRNIRDFYMTWTLWEASAKCIEGSVLMTKNPGFEALCDVETQAQTVNSERWCGLSDDVEGDLFYSIVLQCQQDIPMTHRTLEPGKVVPW